MTTEILQQPKPVAEASPYSRHLPALDGIRGLAILGVMASHLFSGTIGNSLILQAARATFQFGAYGVDLFFALSGFLITGILFDSLGDSRYFRKFYARRCLRIFPLYYGILLLLLLCNTWFLIPHPQFVSLALYLQNTSWITTPVNAGPTGLGNGTTGMVDLGHFWSLAVEEQFYLVWPLLVFLLRRQRTLLWACIAASILAIALRFGLTLAHVPYLAINCNTLCRADSLLAGGALALLLRGAHHDAVLRAGKWIFLAASLGILLRALADSAIPQTEQYLTVHALIFTVRYTLFAAASVGLIILSLIPSRLEQSFKSPMLRFFGKYSYGLYVIHLILYTALRPSLRAALPHLIPSKGFVVAASGLLVLALSILLAYTSYNIFEKQFLRLKRFFDYNKPDPKAA